MNLAEEDDNWVVAKENRLLPLVEEDRLLALVGTGISKDDVEE